MSTATCRATDKIQESRRDAAATSSSLQELGMLEISFLMYLIALPMLADRGRHWFRKLRWMTRERSLGAGSGGINSATFWKLGDVFHTWCKVWACWTNLWTAPHLEEWCSPWLPWGQKKMRKSSSPLTRALCWLLNAGATHYSVYLSEGMQQGDGARVGSCNNSLRVLETQSHNSRMNHGGGNAAVGQTNTHSRLITL